MPFLAKNHQIGLSFAQNLARALLRAKSDSPGNFGPSWDNFSRQKNFFRPIKITQRFLCEWVARPKSANSAIWYVIYVWNRSMRENFGFFRKIGWNMWFPTVLTYEFGQWAKIFGFWQKIFEIYGISYMAHVSKRSMTKNVKNCQKFKFSEFPKNVGLGLIWHFKHV